MIFENEKTFMALKPCRECKKKVSTEAATCPSCGAPRPTLSSIPKKKDIISDGFKEVSSSIDNFKKGYYGAYYKPPKKKETTDDGFTSGFWRGDEGLAKAFWLYFIVGNMLFNVLIVLSEDSPGVAMFFSLAGIVWMIFATIGVFNAADIYKEEKARIGQTFGYATAAKAGAVIAIVSSIGNAL